MSVSDVQVSHSADSNIVDVAARGGSRRERGAAIAAAVRGKGWVRLSISHSETHGFMGGSFARYRKGEK